MGPARPDWAAVLQVGHPQWRMRAVGVLEGAKGCRVTGAELAVIRKAAGLSQTELARRVGIGRHAVSYWECKRQVDRSAWAVERMAQVLALPDMHVIVQVRTFLSRREHETTHQDAAVLAMLQAVEHQIKAIRANRRVHCGAKTRKGTACSMKSELGRLRCKFHGGKSTGAKTMEGKARIAEAQRRRWERWRLERKE